MEQCFAALMWRAADEPDAVYGYAADKVTVSADGLIYKFHLRDGITFHDGTPIKAEDVAFSLDTLKTKGHPAIGNLLRDMDSVEAEGDRDVVVKFKPNRARSAPLTVANLPILSKAYYSKQAFDETSMEPPLGSGPYKVGKFEQGRFVEFERVKDWWGEKLPIIIGQFNFDTLRYDYYRDRDTAFEGFTAKSYTFREEFTSRVWATRYDFPAIKDGRVIKESIPDERPSGMQAWMINLRRDKFQDIKVREAFSIAFDFEWANKNLMFDAYARTQSCFQNSDMMATGKPSKAELALLEPFKDKLSPTCSARPGSRRRATAPGQDRRQLRRSAQLLNEAGWTVKDGKRVNAKDEPLTVEFLAFERVSEPHHALYIKNLAALGIDATLRVVDPVQYRSRMTGVRFRHLDEPDRVAADAGRCAARLLLQQDRHGQGRAELRRHRQSGGRRADRQGDRGQHPPGACTPPARRSIACCARSTTGSPAGSSRRTGSPTGTSSAIRRSSRTTRAASRRPGGTTPTRRRSSAAEARSSLRPTTAAAWRRGRARHAASRSATESARRPTGRHLSPRLRRRVMLP